MIVFDFHGFCPLIPAVTNRWRAMPWVGALTLIGLALLALAPPASASHAAFRYKEAYDLNNTVVFPPNLSEEPYTFSLPERTDSTRTVLGTVQIAEENAGRPNYPTFTYRIATGDTDLFYPKLDTIETNRGKFLPTLITDDRVPTFLSLEFNNDQPLQDVSVTASYILTMSGEQVGFNEGHVATISVVIEIGICDRTEVVRNAILALITPANCEDVRLSDLEGLTGTLDLGSKSITSVKAFDFGGLSSLETLRLNDNTLIGSNLPAGVFADLDSLSVLELDRNPLIGLPESVFAGLGNLTELKLSVSGLTALPENVFAGLSNLTTLTLDNNRLSSLPGNVFADLGLTTLVLHNNPLSALPAGVFADLGSLDTLELQGTLLSSLPGNVFADLGNLTKLLLDTNRLTALPSDVFVGLSNLVRLELHSNQLGALPANVFFGLSNLTRLTLLGNLLSDLPAGVFNGLGRLETLDLQSLQLGALPAGVFAGLSSLTTLDLHDNLLSDLPAGVFAGLSSLTTLDLRNNRLSTLPADGFADLGKLTTLELGNLTTSASINQLGALPANAFRGLSSLTTLDLRDQQLKIPQGDVFAGLGKLTSLLLTDNQLGALPANAFNGLSSLTELNLREQQLSILPANAFMGLDSLTTLDLRLNRLDNNLPVGVFNGLGSLQTLIMVSNIFLGRLPAGVFAGLSNLTFLDLFDDRLSSLPEGVFAGLGRLETLSINYNVLNSLLDGVFAGLDSLVTLNLNYNQLSTLPANVFAGLGNLATLRLDNNQLTVPLPDNVFAGLGRLSTLDLRFNPQSAPVPFPVRLSFQQLPDVAGDSIFQIRSNFPGPTYSINWQATGGSAAAATGSVGIPVGATLSTLISLSDGHTHTAIEITSVNAVGIGFNGFVTGFAGALSINAPQFGQPDGYEFHTLYADTARDIILGTITATSPDSDAAPPAYEITTTDPASATSIFRIDAESGAIRYLGSGNETAGNRYNLTVVATNASATTSVAVAIVVNSPLVFRDTGPFLLSANNRGGLGAIVAIDVDDDKITYSLTAVSANKPETVTRDKFIVDPDNGEVRYIGTGTEDVTDANDYTLSVRATDGRHIVTTSVIVYIGICDRTLQVYGAIVGLINGVSECQDVTETQLRNVTASLDLSNQSPTLTSLTVKDFAGLDNLTELHLNANQLTALSSGVFSDLGRLTTLKLNANQLLSLPANVFAGLGRLTDLDLRDNNDDDFPVTLGLEQLESNSTSLTFQVISSFAGPAFTVSWEATGGNVATRSGTVELTAGAIASTAFGLPIGVGYTTVRIDNAVFNGSFAGFVTNLDGALTIGRPRFGQPGGYSFSTLHLDSVRGAMIGTVAAVDPDDPNVPPFHGIYVSTDSRLFSIDRNTGGIRYRGNGNEVAGRQYNLTVVAIDDLDEYLNSNDGSGNFLLATVAVSITVNSPPQFGANVPFLLPLTDRSAALVLGTITAIDLDGENIRYTLTNVGAAIAGTTTANKFIVDPDSGVLSYSGSGSEDVTGNSDYSLTVQATDGRNTTVATRRVNIGICDRNALVRAKIVDRVVGATGCENVTIANLREITGALDFREDLHELITSLTAMDFAGLNKVTSLNLLNHGLISLPAGAFNDLPLLTSLDLGRNPLSSLPAGVFERLTSLTTLFLEETQLSSLPAGVFERLTSLTVLRLDDGVLTGLPDGVFNSLGNLRELYLDKTQLGSLPVGVFEPLTSLTVLRLDDGVLTGLPDNVFAGLTNLTELNLEGNPGAPFLSLYTLEQLEDESGSLAFRLRNSLPGPPNTLNWRASGNNAVVTNGAAVVAVGAITSAPFTLPAGADYTTVEVISFNDQPSEFKGFTSAHGVALSIGTPVFGQADGYEFNTLYPGSVNGDIIGTISAVNPSDAGVPGYTITALASTSNTFAIDSSGVISYTGSSNETAGYVYNLTVTATNSGNGVTADAAVTIVVNGPPRFTAFGPFALSATNRAALGTIIADDADGQSITYSLTVVVDQEGAFRDDKFAVDPNSGVLSYIGSGTEDVIDNFAYNMNIRATDGSYFVDQTVRVNIGICDRTEQVREGIVAVIDNSSPGTFCDNVTTTELNALGSAAGEDLSLFRQGITSLTAADFAGLGNLTLLDLQENQLSNLPADVFSALVRLSELSLGDNRLSGLPGGLFVGLSHLTTLELNGNSLVALPEELFAGLSGLTSVDLNGNRLSDLADGLFADIGNVTTVNLNGNRLSRLPGRLFAGFSQLTTVNVSGNPGAPFTVTLRVEQLADDSSADPVFRVNTDIAGPVYSAVGWRASGDVSVVQRNGTVAIAAGATTSTTFTLPSTSSTPSAGYATITLTSSNLNPGFVGFDTALGPTLNIDAPQFEQPAGYVFATLSPNSVGGAVLGTVTAVIPTNTSIVPVYAITAATAGAGSLFNIDNNGVIYYIGSGNETPGDRYYLIVTATNTSDNAAVDVAVAIVVNSPPQFAVAGTLFLTATDRSAPLALATITASDADGDSITYALVAVTAATTGVTTNGKFTVDPDSGVLSYIGATTEDVTDNASYALTVRATVGSDIVVATVMVNIGICDRTMQVRNGIVSLVNLAGCEDITISALNDATGTLDLSNQNFTSLAAGDFLGLSDLTVLNLYNNFLSNLPSGVFDDLDRLSGLELGNNFLNNLPSGIFDKVINLRTLNINTNDLNNLPDGVFNGLGNLTELDVSNNVGAPFPITLGMQQLVDDTSAASVFLVRSNFAGPAYSEVIWEASGSAEAETGTAMVAAGATASTPFTLPEDSENTVITLISNTLQLGFTGFTTNTAPALVINAPRFEQPEGYTFNTLFPNSQRGDILGTVTAIDPSNESATPDYVFTAPINIGNTFNINDNGVISYRGNSNEIPGRRHELMVGASNTSTNVVTEVAVTMVVNTPPQFRISGPFTLSATNRVALGTVVAVDVDSDTFAYTLVAVTAAASGAITEDKFAIDATSGVLSYIGSGTEDVANNASYALVVRAADNRGVEDAVVLINIGICDRTAVVQTAIINLIISAVNCENVTTARLAGVTGTLNLSELGLASVEAADFAGLSNLDQLRLDNNLLTTLPEGVFNHLGSLSRLYLYSNQLSSLPAGAFTGLSGLNELSLFHNQLVSLPAEVFNGLGNLTILYLDSNQLVSLPASVFNGLGNLSTLELNDNRLITLSDGVFAGLGLLNFLDLRDNRLISLPANVFAGLGGLSELHLGNNPGVPFPITLGVQQVAVQQVADNSSGDPVFFVRSNFAGPAYSEVGVEATGSGVATVRGTVTIVAGATASIEFTVPSGGYTTVDVISASLSTAHFSGFILFAAPGLTINAPRFERPEGYIFELDKGHDGSVNAILVGTISASDPNRTSVNYSIASGDTSRFSLNTNSGAIFYIGSGEPISRFYALTMEASDGVLTTGVEVRINVINDSPEFAVSAYSFDLNEAQSTVSVGFAIGTVMATDSNGDILTYSIINGNTSRFSFRAGSGVLQYIGTTGESFGGVYTLDVQASDGFFTAAAVVTVTVMNEPPLFSAATYSFNVNEGISGLQTTVTIGTVEAIDPDNSILTYSIIAGDSGRFNINGGSGALYYVGSGDPEGASYALTVRVSDNVLTDIAAVVVVVVNEPPVFDDTYEYRFSLNEGLSGTNEAAIAIGTVEAIDPDNDTVTYVISGGDTTPSRFRLGLNSGALHYIGAGEISGSNYNLTVQAITSKHTVPRVFTVMVINDPPVFRLSAYEFSVGVNRSGTETAVVVGTVVATDINSDVILYSIVPGDDGAKFRIGSANGGIAYIGSGESTGTSLRLTVAASDAINPVVTATVSITAINDPPVFDPATYSFVLNADDSGIPTAIPVGTVTATDPNSDIIAYSVASDGSDTRFSVNSASGVIAYIGSGEVSGVNFDLTVIATDNAPAALFATAGVTITVRPIVVGMRTQMTSMSLAQVSRNIAIDTVDVIGGRFAAVPHVTVSGYALNAQQWQGAARWMRWDHWQSVGAWNGAEREITWDDIDLGPRWDRFRDNLLTGTSFLVSLGAVEGEGGEEETEGGSSGWFGDWSLGLQDWSLWGQGRISGYEYTAGGMKVDGQVLSGYLGVDYQVNDELLFGVAVSRSGSEGHSQMSDGSNPNRTDIDTVLVSVYPYLRWTPAGTDFNLWGTLGHGEGVAEVSDATRSKIETDLEIIASAFGAEQGLLLFGNTKLAVKVDGFAVQMKSDSVTGINATDSESHRLRAALAGSYNWLVGDYSHIFGGLELGARLDGGDAVQGLGLDMGADLGYANTGIGLETHSRVRFLVAHSDEYSDWGLDMTVRLRPGQLGRGLAVSLAPGWGQAATAIDSLWKNGAAALKPTVASSRGLIPDRTKLALRYGLHYRRALWSPFAEMGMERDDVSALKLGIRVDTPQLWMEVFGSRDRSIGVEGVLNF